MAALRSVRLILASDVAPFRAVDDHRETIARDRQSFRHVDGIAKLDRHEPPIPRQL